MRYAIFVCAAVVAPVVLVTSIALANDQLEVPDDVRGNMLIGLATTASVSRTLCNETWGDNQINQFIRDGAEAKAISLDDAMKIYFELRPAAIVGASKNPEVFCAGVRAMRAKIGI